MKVLLLTTCICNEQNISDLKRLILSINRVEKIHFEHIILLQNSDQYCDKELFELSTNYSMRTLSESKIISLSKARNVLISEAEQLGLFTEVDFVSFPDDDCWYPDTFWDNFSAVMKKENVDLFYTQFSSQPSNSVFNENSHTTSSLIRNASSNTTFYKLDVFKSIGLFDEAFGVGAKNNGGEDIDFAIRASFHSQKTYYYSEPVIGHRDPLPEFRYKYFQGSFGVLNKYKLKSFSLFYSFIRKFLVGVVFYLQGKIKLSDFRVRH